MYKLSDHARKFPNKPAIIMGNGQTLTFAELEQRSDSLAQRLYDLGLRFGDHFAIMMDNRLEYAITIWAAQRSGLILTPINWHLAAEEAAYVIGDSGARVVISSDGLMGLLRQVTALAPKVEHWLVAGDADGFEPMEAPTGEIRYEALEGQALCYSSGTSGKPKGIDIKLQREPFGTATMVERLLTEFMGYDANTVYLSPAPLYHTAPFIWTKVVVRNGGTAIIMEKFEPEECLKLIEKHRPNLAQFVPTMFIRMLKLPEDIRKRYDVSSLGRAVHAAAPCPVEIKERMIAWWGPVLFEYYAGSEGGWVQITSEEWLQHKGSVGKSELIHVLDNDHAELPPGKIGLIYFEPFVRFEYRGDPEKTRETYSPQGWFTLGDMGYKDEQGYLFLTDRKSHMIISGGVNIYPQETENVLVCHPAVSDVAVIGVPNEDLGEEVKAVVVLDTAGQASESLANELIGYCRERIAHYKCPRSVDFVEELPRLPSGKLLKRQLRARYWP